MSCAAAETVGSTGRPEIFSQRGEEIRRVFGFEPRGAFFATAAERDRFASVIPDFDISGRVIGACIEVHRVLGPGLLENVYEDCLCRELTLRELKFERQKQLPIEDKGALLDHRYRADLIVEGSLLVEVKAIDKLLGIHAAQVITYLRIGNLPSGLLINFNETALRGDAMKRLWRTPKPS